MLHRGLLMVVLCLGIASVAYAQDGGDTACDALLEAAMQQIGSACAQMGPDEVCYGHNRVVATLRNPGLSFEVSGDLVPVTVMESLFTEPADPASGTWGIAMITLRTQDEPLLLVLFGDTEVTEIATPNEVAASCTITNDTTSNINIRSGPSTERGIVGMVPTGDTVTVSGRNTAGDWYYIDRNGVTGWVFASLFAGDCPNLPEASEAEAAAPTHTISVRTGAGGVCEDTPNMLMIHVPEGQRSRVVVNGVQLELASTGYVTAVPDGQMVIHGLEGQITVGSGDDAVTLLPGYWTVVELDGLQGVGTPAPAQLIPSAGIVPILVDVVVYGEDIPSNLVAEREVGVFACEIDESLQFDIPLSYEPDVETTIGLSFGASEGVAATLAELDSLRVTCLQPGTHTLFLSIQYGNDLAETLSYTFVVGQD